MNSCEACGPSGWSWNWVPVARVSLRRYFWLAVSPVSIDGIFRACGPKNSSSWLSQTTSATGAIWNAGSTLGKRKLAKASTAPVLVTTEANKRLVVNGLIKKSQAKNLRLRVIHTAADGTLTQDVFDA